MARGALAGLGLSFLAVAAAGVMTWQSGTGELFGAAWMIVFGFSLPWSIASKWVAEFTVIGGWATVMILAPMLQAALSRTS